MTKDESDDESFKSFQNDAQEPLSKTAETVSQPRKLVVERYSKEEERRLLDESNAAKKSGNDLFGKGSFENAIQTYDRALASCPNYLDFELAVLRSNIAACHIKLKEWKEAVESASKGLENLDKLEPLPQLPRVKDPRSNESGPTSPPQTSVNDNAAVEEVDDDLADRIENLQLSGHTIHEVRSIQTKLLLRRAKAKSSLTGWADLQAADEDYRTLLLPAMQATLTNSDHRIVIEGQRALVPRLTEAREREVADMMGKLKGLGNSILKPFGLSTENFQFVKDENSGGYSMNFSQTPSK